VRIGVVIYGSLDTISGGYLYDRSVVDHLRQRGVRVEIISLPWRDYGRHLSDNLSRHLFDRLRQAPFELLLQDELNHPSLFWLNQRLRRWVRYPLLAIVHHLRFYEARPNWQNCLYRWVERRYLKTLDGYIFNSQTTRSSVEGLVGTGRPFVVAQPGRDRLRPSLTTDQIATRARQPGPLRILFIGSLIPRKGLHTLLEGLSCVPGDGWRLEVVGSQEVDPSYARAIRHQVAALGLATKVTLSGYLSDAELASRLASSHLLCVPSFYEGFGIAYLEGMGAGLPAIASTAGAAGEIITHGQNGFLVPPDDTSTLACYVQTLIQDRERLIEMSLAAFRRYVTHPTWAESGERVFQFLKQWLS
jgi:glycosyltransferase involved in cell wall biosynthesis